MPSVRTLLTCCLLSAVSATAQLPAGHYVGTMEFSGPGTGRLITYEPLTGVFASIDGALSGQPWPAEQVLALPRRGQLLVAGGIDPAGNQLVRILTIDTGQVIDSQPFASGFGGTIRDIAQAPSGEFLVSTDTRVFLTPPDGGLLSTELPFAALANETVVAAVATTDEIAILSRRDDQGILTILPGDGSFGAGPIFTGILQPTAMVWNPLLDSFLIGDENGALYLVSQQSGFVPAVLDQLDGSPVRSLVFSSDFLDVLVAGAGGQLARLESDNLLALMPSAFAGEVLDLDYIPYEGSFEFYGSNCGDARSPVMDAAGRPFPGTPFFAVSLSQAPPGSLAVLLLGRQGVNFPLDLLGMTGCSLLVDGLIGAPRPTQANATGRGVLPLEVPADPALAGFEVFFQWAVVDPDANLFGVTSSQGGRARF